MKIPVIGTAIDKIKANPGKAGRIGAFTALAGLAVVGVNSILKGDSFSKHSNSGAPGGAAHAGDVLNFTGMPNTGSGH